MSWRLTLTCLHIYPGIFFSMICNIGEILVQPFYLPELQRTSFLIYDTKMGSVHGKAVNNAGMLIDAFSKQMPRPATIQNFIDFGKNPQEDVAFKFLRREIPVRLAHIIKEISALPEALQKIPTLEAIQGAYNKSFQEIVVFHKENITETSLERFLATLLLVQTRHANVIKDLAAGVNDLKNSRNRNAPTETAVQFFLDRFYMSRIGIRMLIKQHSLLFQKNSNSGILLPRHIGAFDMQCNLKTVIEDAYGDAKVLCENMYGECPSLILEHLSGKNNVVYIPDHIHYVMFELFKNSMRAVLQNYAGNTADYPPLKVSIVEGKEDVCIKLSDLGKGIARSQSASLFKYAFSTAPTPDSQELAPFAGFGYGLPLARLHARYFNGDLSVLTTEGLGTDTVLYLKASPAKAAERIPVYSDTTYECLNSDGDNYWSKAVPQRSPFESN